MRGKDLKGNFFEDFRLGQVIRHGTPRTLTDGDSSVFLALTGSRYLAHSSSAAAALLGFQQRPIDDLLVFNVAFGKTVPDISLNAVANLGYAEMRFFAPVFPGDTLHCESVVLGLKENSSRKTGVVYVRSTCYDQRDRTVLSWVRWVMVKKKRTGSRVNESYVPVIKADVAADQLIAHAALASREAQIEWSEATGSDKLWDHYAEGEEIHHPSGITMEEADHMQATRLYQNNAVAHFDAFSMKDSPIGRRLVYGGHVISVCRTLAYDGLENTISISAVNSGSHVSPTVAGDTLYASTQVLQKWKLPGRVDVGALRLRMLGMKNTTVRDFPSLRSEVGARVEYDPSVVLDLDYTVLMPRRLHA